MISTIFWLLHQHGAMYLLIYLLSAAGSLLALPVSSTSGSPSSHVQVNQQLSGPLPSVGNPVATVPLGEHTFVNSWGDPYVTNYTPPQEEFTHVRITLHVSSFDIQYDRLAKLYIGNSEIWRTSTAEPTGGNMSYSFTKDLTTYLTLFKAPQEVVFDLGNTVNSELSGSYTTQLTLFFYKTAPTVPTSESVFDSYSERYPATDIIAIRPKSQTGKAHVYTLPSEPIDFYINPLPKNTTRVVLDIFASGSGKDEFWYFNTLPQNVNAFEGTTLPGNYPSRLIEVTVDDSPAGLVLPFPVIFTGGLSPSLWIPNVGINAFDLPSYALDITPLLPKLWNGARVKIAITSGFGNLANFDWYVNANILTWQTPGITGSGQVVQGTHANNTNNFTSNHGESLKELLSITRDASSQALLTFTNAAGVSESAFVKTSQTLSYTNAKSYLRSTGERQIAQVSSGYCMLRVSKPGDDLTKFQNGIDSDTIPADFSVVFPRTDSNSDLELKATWKYIYPLAVNFISSNQDIPQIHVKQGYLLNNIETGGVWTRQNTSVLGDYPAANQYLVQHLIGTDSNSSITVERFSGTSNYSYDINTTGYPKIGSVVGFGETDKITTSVSRAANTAYNQKDQLSEVESAIDDIFHSVFPESDNGKPANEPASSALQKIKRSSWKKIFQSTPLSDFMAARLVKREKFSMLGRNPFQ